MIREGWGRFQISRLLRHDMTCQGLCGVLGGATEHVHSAHSLDPLSSANGRFGIGDETGAFHLVITYHVSRSHGFVFVASSDESP